ncbi:squalene/phytoene synthase family protein [Phenylobacterium sp.]|uniref:squalene/phytoene synthase family protein n=1 Tax=Phenylobacterium sp. TaxID=1871053 RepID=UPI0025F58AAD|nr:squalene/phytoene synthase family protein [Phenylobacterium sp.]
MDDDLDDLIRRVDPDRWLSSRFVEDAATRADVIAIYAYDHELGRAPRVASNPLLGEIRLTWWREMLDETYEGRHVRHHPAAQALAAAIERRGLPREPLEAMIDARYRELDATPMNETEALDWARDTGGRAAEAAARILDPAAKADLAHAPGAVWALGRRLPDQPDLRPAFDKVLTTAKTAVRMIGVQAFPAVAHAVLAGRPNPSEFAKRWRLTLAVARGKI